ncbi:MAG: translation elongation factor Ts [Burkholderiaceae bacterium]
MAVITAAMVKELREKTDAPMMECKKALTEAAGDMARAEEILRVKLGNKASKAAARVAAEGVIGIHVSEDGQSGAIVELNSETDFVAKNDDFLKFSQDLAVLAAERAPADVEALSELPLGGTTVDEHRKTLIGRIGENMTVRRFTRFEAKGRISSYLHGGARIGVLVDLIGGDVPLARDIAMHIAASKPKALSREGVPAEDIERERSIAAQKAAESGKPEAIVEKMVEGTIQKYLKEVTLLGQVFVKDPDGKQTIEQLLKANNAQVADFALYVVGEGIEKKQADFAAEVAAQAAAASR